MSEHSLAMALLQVGTPLQPIERPIPTAGPGELLIRVNACGVCRTDLHIVDGELPALHLPLVPGHEVVGTVVASGPGAEHHAVGDRVGVPWLAGTCGVCTYCRANRENLCDVPQFTGYSHDGGYATHAVARADFCFPLTVELDDVHAAPLLCAGLIGYRALRMSGDARRLGIYGFGAAAHLMAQVAVAQGRDVFAFTRPGDDAGQAFARSLGCRWAGASNSEAPESLDAAIIFAPVGALVPAALTATRKGATVVCAGIHMSDVPSFPYRLLWGERVVRSVANLTRADGEEFLGLAARIGLRTQVEVFPLVHANEAIAAVRHGRIHGAAVLDCR